MSEYLLRAVDIVKTFAGVKALQGVCLDIKPGEIHCLAGENGCGKSTLIKVISGVYQPNAGYIEFNGQRYTSITPRESIAMGIQVIYQDFSIFPNLTVMENLAFNTELAAGHKLANKKRMRKIAEEALSKINFDVELDQLVGKLSVAEKQMVAICRALMFDAKLIIMDEPTTALTKKEVAALFEIILKLKAQGIAILFVSHKLNEVFEISERFTIFRSGQLIATGNTADLDDKKFTFYMTGREFEDVKFKPAFHADKPVLEVRHLTVPGAFEDVSFALRPGQILGITGLLDSGRTELSLALFGLRKTSGGEILMKGQKVEIGNPRDAIAAGIGLVPEDRLSEGLFLPQPISENIVISEIDELSSKLGVVNRSKRQEEVTKWVKELAIATPNPDNACSTLSGGNQQRIVLAKWLACKPDVLILNGPTVGVDIGSKHDIHAILQRLANQGMAIIIISDDLPEVLENCSDLLIMRAGRIVAQLDPATTDEALVLQHMM